MVYVYVYRGSVSHIFIVFRRRARQAGRQAPGRAERKLEAAKPEKFENFDTIELGTENRLENKEDDMKTEGNNGQDKGTKDRKENNGKDEIFLAEEFKQMYLEKLEVTEK